MSCRSTPALHWGTEGAAETPASPTSRCLRLRAPKSPDATADIAHHQFTYAVMPHLGEQWAELGPVGTRRVEGAPASLGVSVSLAVHV